ncbi:MAG: hypothetical protein FWD92_00375 [Methanomassiliicoccaceae archaeon]|nr:hypothetical protein [Methanomassiliicoccaceae archaeon]
MRKLKAAVDILMFAALIVTLFTMRGNATVHTVAGCIFIILMVIHVMMHRKWITGVTKKLSKVKPEIRKQYITNVIMAVMWSICIVTGVILGAGTLMAAESAASAGIRRAHGITGAIALILTVVHVIQHRRRFITLLKGTRHGTGHAN